MAVCDAMGCGKLQPRNCSRDPDKEPLQAVLERHHGSSRRARRDRASRTGEGCLPGDRSRCALEAFVITVGAQSQDPLTLEIIRKIRTAVSIFIIFKKKKVEKNI